MPPDSEVWQALLRAKGLTVAELATRLHTTRQHAHRLLTGRRSAEQRREDIDRALALGRDRDEGRPAYALAVLSPSEGEVELLPAGDTQPLFGDRELATHVANSLAERNGAVCVVPVWPDYAWRRLVAFHAAWGSDPEPRRIFLVDDPTAEIPVEVLLEDLRGGFAETLRLRGAADDPACLREVDALIERLN
jgi:transcriptional regulator with XRE-family HTH domain